MATTARLDLSVWRNDDAYDYRLFVHGADLSGLALRMQLRLAPDTPGAPLVDLAKVSSPLAEGVRVASVFEDDGVIVSEVRIRLNRSTRQALPYAGELGDATPLAYAFQIDGRTRLVGQFFLLAHAMDSDAAPMGRPEAYGGQQLAAYPGTSTSLTIAGDDVVSMTIDGADLVDRQVTQAGAFATSAGQKSADAAAAAVAAAAARDEAAAHASAAAANGAYPTIAAGLAATAEGGYFSVIGTDDAFLNLYRRVYGAAVFVTRYPSLTGVRAAVAGAEYIGRMRAVLNRCFLARKIPGGAYLRSIAKQTALAAKIVTTDGSNIPLYRPDGSGAYNSVWIRDWSMAAHSAPELCPAQELRDGFEWYAGKVNQSVWWVPDHVGADGAVSFRAGNDDLGVRAPLDGNTFLVQLAWLAYAKAGDTSIYDQRGAFLRGLLDGMPRDGQTGCIMIPAGQESPGFGFVDSVRLNGSIASLTAFAFNGYRQVADMAFASGDLEGATYCIGQAETLFAALNATLWAGSNQTGSGDGPNGLFRFSNGTFSHDQLDVWISAYASYVGATTPERERAISTTLALNFNRMVGNAPALFARGGVRHVLADNEYQVGSKVFESYLLPATYGLYQSGPGWQTPNAWTAFALGITRPDLAAAMIRGVLREVNIQTRRDVQAAAALSYGSIAAGRDATVAKGFFKVAGQLYQRVLTDSYQGIAQVRQVVAKALLAEWVSRDPGPTDDPNGEAVIGNGTYLTSACALLSMDVAMADPVETISTRMTIAAANLALPQGQWVKAPFSVVLDDGLGAVDQQAGVLRTLGGAVEIATALRVASASGVPELQMAIFIEGNLEKMLFDKPVGAGGLVVDGTWRFPSLAMGAAIDIRLRALGADATIQNLDGDNARYSTLTASWRDAA